MNRHQKSDIAFAAMAPQKNGRSLPLCLSKIQTQTLAAYIYNDIHNVYSSKRMSDAAKSLLAGDLLIKTHTHGIKVNWKLLEKEAAIYWKRYEVRRTEQIKQLMRA